MFARRPKPGEEEEDIIEQEKAFLKDKKNAAATAIRVGVGGRKEQEQGQGQDLAEEEEEDVICPDIDEPSELVLQPTIVEKVFDVSKLMNFGSPKPKPELMKKGKSLFANAKMKGLSLSGPSGSKKGTSLFAQMYDAQYGEGEEGGPSVPLPGSEGGGVKVIGDQIHPYLTGMTEKDILEEQRKLMETMDPKLVEFVKSRYNKKKGGGEGESSSSRFRDPGPGTLEQEGIHTVATKDKGLDLAGEDVVMSEAKIEDNLTSSLDVAGLPINPKIVKGIPHMNKIELDKLEWAGVVNENRIKLDKMGEGESARFDFDGMLLTGQDLDTCKTFEKGLHHHGEEMDKPGYTLEELLVLSRSANNQQKARALQIIGNIYSKAHTGVYDLVLEMGLFELWEHMDFVYSIRKGLDEGDKTLINEAIHCLASILYPWEEEMCLDVIYAWDFARPHPWISTKIENVKATLEPGEDEKEMKDDEMLRMDILEFFIHRSNILDRFAYFLSGDFLTPMGVFGILKILIRVARHSPDTLINHDLIDVIIKNYTVPNWSSAAVESGQLKGVPLGMAFKIVRILADSNAANALKIYNDYHIFSSVTAYLAYDDWKSNTSVEKPEQLVIESFRIWIAMLHHGIAIDEYRNFFPVLMKFLVLYQSIDKMTVFDLIHSGYLFCLLLSILSMKDDVSGLRFEDKHSHWELVKDCVVCVKNIVIKLLTVLCCPHLTSEYNEAAMMWTISRGLLFMARSFVYDKAIRSSRLLDAVKLFLGTSTYERITANLRSHSLTVVYNRINVNCRYPQNFASVGAVKWGGDYNPILVLGSSIPLLSSLITFHNIVGELLPFDSFVNRNIKQYVSDFLQCTRTTEPPDFFIRFELGLILRLAQAYPPDSRDRFNLTYNALSFAPKCCSKLFNELFKIAITCSCDTTDLEMCFKIYGGYLLFQDNEGTVPIDSESGEVPNKRVRFSPDAKKSDGCSSSSLCFEKWSEYAIEAQWVLEPLHRIRTIVASTPNFLEKNIEEVELQCRICLRLIEKCLQKHSDVLIKTRKDFVNIYCAVCQVFLLGDPRVYLDEGVRLALIGILQSLLACSGLKTWEDKPVFSTVRQASGHPNMFFDFYPELVKEYSENSYFNEVFANYVLLPLRIPEDAQLKSNFWIVETIQLFKLSFAKILVPLDYLTHGVETDSSLLYIYMRLLKSGRIQKQQNEFLFELLKTLLHNAVFVSNNSEDENMIKLKSEFNLLKL